MSVRANPSKMIIFVIVFVDLLGFGVMIPMLPFFARSFHATALEVGLLMNVYSLMQIVVAPIWGQLSDRLGRRPILLLTILGQALAFLWGGLSGSYLSLLLSRVAAGIFAANISTASAYMADITKPEERASGMGLIGAAFGLGFIFGPAIGGLLIPHGASYPSLAAAAICALNFVLAFFILREPLRDRTQRQGNRRRFSLEAIRKISHNVNLWIPMLAFFIITFAFVQLEISFGMFVVDRFRFEPQDAGFLLAYLGVVMALVQGGLLRPLAKRYRESLLIWVGAFVASASLYFVSQSIEKIGLYIGLLGVAFGYSLMNPCLSALVSRSASAEEQGSILGTYQSVGSLARVLAPLLAGYLYDQRMDLPVLTAGVFVFMMFIFWSLRGRQLIALGQTSSSR